MAGPGLEAKTLRSFQAYSGPVANKSMHIVACDGFCRWMSCQTVISLSSVYYMQIIHCVNPNYTEAQIAHSAQLDYPQ